MRRMKTIAVVVMLIVLIAVIISKFYNPSKVDDFSIVMLSMGLFAFLGAIVMKPSKFWENQLKYYPVSLGMQRRAPRVMQLGVRKTKKILYVVSATSTVVGIIGFFV